MKQSHIIRLIMILSFLLVTKVSFASINLGGGTLKPRGRLTLSLQKLKTYMTYDIVCHVNDDNQQHNPVVMSLFPVGHAFWDLVSLNHGKNRETDLGIWQYRLPQATNTFTIYDVNVSSSKNTFLGFQNADRQNAIAINNCQAVATAW